jgi:TolA-binding protein
LIFRGDYEQALTVFQTAYYDASDAETRAAALYGQGLTHYKNDNWAAASQVLTDLTANYSDSPRAAQSELLLGEIADILEKPADAAIHYRKYLDRRPGVLDYYVFEKLAIR